MTHRLATNCAKNYCNRTLIVKVIVENVVTCFLGHGVVNLQSKTYRLPVLMVADLSVLNVTSSLMSEVLHTLYKKPFSLLTGSLVNCKECSLKKDSIAIGEHSTPTTVSPLSASLQHTELVNGSINDSMCTALVETTDYFSQ